jgi:protein TonB
MERPSHLPIQRLSSVFRLPSIGLAVLLQFAGLWLFTQGLSQGAFKFVPPIWVDPIAPQPLPRTPPPPLPPQMQIEIPKVPVPSFTTDLPPQSKGGITAATNTPPAQGPAPSKPAGIDRAAVGITATHTTPPYQPIARRLGAEGTVTLRLTVGTDGQVTAAEVVKSAGREDLDQAARDWIIAHWRYRPALKDGNPAVVQALASVTYSLKNQ